VSTVVSERRCGTTGEDPHPQAEPVLPLLAERVSVSRRRIETSELRATVTTHVNEQVIEEDLVHERVEVERIPIDRVVETVPPIRQEGNTTIIPVVEEMLVIERRLVLKEEVHVRRVTVRETHVEAVAIRAQEVVVTHIDRPAQQADKEPRHDHPQSPTETKEELYHE
jgi:uncharacterized protein (TIGR02271 family)